MTEREEIEKAITALDTQRASLGSAAVEAAQAGLRKRLAEIEKNPYVETGDSQNSPWPEERKSVTILFADISGFTALSEKTDSEIVRGLINACFSRLVPIVLQYEGTVEKFIGDEIMAVFGAPVAHENDPERGVQAALEMIKTLNEFNTEAGTDLGLHIGINTGPVVTGGIGSDHLQQYGVMGDAVNLAARLTEAAEREQIFVGHHTQQLTASKFQYTMLPAMRFKGKSEPIQVYQLVGLKEEPGRARGLEGHGISSPLVGRRAEYQNLYASFEHLMDEQGGMTLVYGEAGLGKTRLLAEIRKNVHTDRILLIECNLLAYGQSLSYWPFQEILRKYAGITEKDSETSAWSKLETKIAHLFSEDEGEIIPYLASLLNLEVPEKYQERVKYLDGEAMGKQIFLAMWRFFERLAGEQPVALVFEDLHWIDASSESLLQHILSLIPQVPLLIVGLSRPGSQIASERLYQAALKIDPSHCQQIRLSPLTNQESLQLLRNLLNLNDISELRELVISKADGNPFFLEEVIRTLIDRQVVVPGTVRGTWRVTEMAGAIAIPDTIQGLISARLDRLDEEVKQVARLASIIGRSFLYRVLCAIGQDIQRVDEGLNELQEIELIAKKQQLPELEYIFRHALAQEVAYESILLQKRRDLHARVANAIEMLFSDRIEDFYSLLAYHYAKAESWEKALDFLIKAGNQAGRIAGDAEALEYYQQAMAAYAHMYGDRWDPFQRATLEHRIGEALYRRGENYEALNYFKSALAHLGYPVSNSRSEIRRIILFGMGKQLFRRLAGIRYQMHHAKDSSPMIEEVYRLYLVIGWITVFHDQEYYAYVMIKSLELAERHYHPLLATGLSSLGIIFDFLPSYRLADGFHRMALEVAQNPTQPDRLGGAYAYICLSLHEALAGKYNDSIEYGRQAREIYWEIGDLHGWGLTSETMGQVLVYQGNFTQALEVGQRLLDLGNEVGDPELRCWGMLVMGTAEYPLGLLQQAHDHLWESTQLAKQISDYYSILFAGGLLGQCFLSRGEFEPGFAILEECRQVSIEHRMRGNAVTPTYHGLMKAHLMLAEQGDPTQKGKWLAMANADSWYVWKQAKAFRGGLPEALQLSGHLERLKGNSSKTQLLWQRSLAEAEQMGMQYMVGMMHRELGIISGDPYHKSRVDEIFNRLDIRLNKGECIGYWCL